MSKKILKVGFSRLRKDEVRDLANRVIKIVEKHDPETLKIKEVFDLLVELQPQINSLDLGYIAHPLSETLYALRRKRNGYAQGIIDRIKLVETVGDGDMQESLRTAKPIVLQHLKSLGDKDNTKVTQSVESFVQLLKLNAKLAAAIEVLELDSYIESLQIVSSVIDMHFDERLEDISQREKGATLKIVNAIKIALEYLFMQIELGRVKNQELNYKPLIDEVNEQIALFKVKVKTRASNNKKKAEKALNDKEVVEDNGVVVMGKTEGVLDTNQSVQRMFPLSEKIVDENSDSLVIEKTVAVSGKQTRLPIVSTEA